MRSGSFTLTASPTSLTIAQGSSGTSTITVEATDGFDQEVTLTASGVPSGSNGDVQPEPNHFHQHVDADRGRGGSNREVNDHHHRHVLERLSKKTKVKLTVTAP